MGTVASKSWPQPTQVAGEPGVVNTVANQHWKCGGQVQGLRGSRTPWVTFQRSSRR